MKVIIDTREKKDKIGHLTTYFNEHDVQWFRSKLIVGDYQNPLNPTIVVDRKCGLQEVVGNVTTQHSRFVRELELAKELGFKLIVLIEEPNIKTLGDVPSWYNWRLKKNPKAVSGKKLYRIMCTMQEKYGVIWLFTKKSECGKKLVELLSGGK